MIDPIPAIDAIVNIVGTGIAIATLRRNPKQPKPFTPVSTMILTIDQDRGPDLPTYDPGMSRMGFDRFNRNNR